MRCLRLADTGNVIAFAFHCEKGRLTDRRWLHKAPAVTEDASWQLVILKNPLDRIEIEFSREVEH